MEQGMMRRAKRTMGQAVQKTGKIRGDEDAS
jgi:hypothetical protein